MLDSMKALTKAMTSPKGNPFNSSPREHFPITSGVLYFDEWKGGVEVFDVTLDCKQKTTDPVLKTERYKNLEVSNYQNLFMIYQREQ